jgi:hypothetical protein
MHSLRVERTRKCWALPRETLNGIQTLLEYVRPLAVSLYLLLFVYFDSGSVYGVSVYGSMVHCFKMQVMGLIRYVLV